MKLRRLTALALSLAVTSLAHGGTKIFHQANPAGVDNADVFRGIVNVVFQNSGTITLPSVTMTIGDGTAANPSIEFTSDDDATGTGIYRVGADNLGISTNGTVALDLEADNDADFAGQLLVTDGTAADPSIVFETDDDGSGTGVYRSAADTFAVAANGTSELTIAAGDFTIVGSRFNTTPSGDTSMLAADALTVTNRIMRVVGNGGAVDLTSTPHIVDASDGTWVTIQGTSNANTVEFNDENDVAGSGLELDANAAATLGLGDTLTLFYDSGDDKWYEVARSAN